MIEFDKTIARICYPIDVSIEMIETYLSKNEQGIDFNNLSKEEQEKLLLDVADNYFETSSIESYVLERYDTPNKTIELEVKERLVATIEQDDCDDSPDTWGNNDVFLVANHRQFEVERDGFDCEGITRHITATLQIKYYESKGELHENESEDRDECLGDIVEEYNNYHIFPLIAYIHSGVALSINTNGYPFNCRWDSGQIGWVLVCKKEKIYSGNTFEWKDVNEEKAEKYAEGLVETWNQYLSGDVWHIKLEKQLVVDEDDKRDVVIQEEYIDSTGGMWGYDYAKEEIECWIKSELEVRGELEVIRNYN